MRDDVLDRGQTTALMSAAPSAARSWVAQLRAVGMAVAAASAAASLYQFQVLGRPSTGWWYLLAAVVTAFGAQLGLRYPAPAPAAPAGAASRGRRVTGLLLAALGAALWAFSSWRIAGDWGAEFDNAWLGWTAAVVLLGVGLDRAWGTWEPPAERRWGPAPLAMMGILLAVAALYRLGNIADFPGEAAITQIEDLQVGNFGWAYLHGYRWRWEYLSSTWLAALGIWLGGPSQLAMRVPFAVVSALKVVPLFIWLRLMVGTTGALVGTALLACSFWDVVLSRIPNNHNALVVSMAFALLAGPARRGRPSAYVVLGYLSGYILHEYIAYRPLAAFALAGAAVWSVRDTAVAWWLRLARPAITLVLLATMVAPLFLVRLSGDRFQLEYLDGWNRARGITGYYNPEDTWSTALARRVARAQDTAELFTYVGDRSPVRNVPEQPPLIDPVACALLVLGIAGAAATLLQPLHALTLAGLVVTVSGTLILTGNFDVARVGGAVPYVYALVGLGAAGLATTWAQAWGRVGRWAAAALLALAVLGGAAWSTRYLLELWTNPSVKQAHRNPLAYLTIWMRNRVGLDERVIGIAPGYTNVLEGHDGSWLRGGPRTGVVAWDIESALREWQKQPGPVVFFVFAGRATSAVAELLSTRFPELHFAIDHDPLGLQADVAFVRAEAPPAGLAEQLASWHCTGARAEFRIVGPDPGEVQFERTLRVPFIAKATWPGEIPERLYRLTRRPSGIEVRYTADFVVTTGGEYRFALDIYAGTGSLLIDGRRRDRHAHVPVPLTPGLHRLEVTGNFAPMALEPNIELRWSGPDTKQRVQVMPLYRVALPDPSCAGGPAPPHPTSGPTDAQQSLRAAAARDT